MSTASQSMEIGQVIHMTVLQRHLVVGRVGWFAVGAQRQGDTKGMGFWAT